VPDSGVEMSFLQLTGSFRCPASFMLMPAAGVAKQNKHLKKGKKDKVCLAFA